jgi:hypothetical protein
MKVVCKGKAEFLEVNTFGDGKFLNPFYINIDHIRYIREYTEVKESDKKAWAIFVGNKMFTTNEDLGLSRSIPGDTVKIGSRTFECFEGSSLSEKINCLFFVNYDNVLYMRKYIINDKDGKNYKNDRVNDSENHKFAIITVDERMIPGSIKLNNYATIT